MPGTTCYREERVNEWEGEIKSDAESVSEWEGATKIDAENGVSMRGEEIVEDNEYVVVREMRGRGDFRVDPSATAEELDMIANT